MADLLNPALGFAAGVLTILSPCVLPLVPVVLASAARADRRGPLALAAGLVLSFTATGLALARLGANSAFDPDIVRLFGACLLMLAGLFLLVQRLQDWLALAASPLAAWANRQQSGLARYGLAGQAGIGGLLGLVWSPCVGPTLGAATVLAAQGRSLGAAALTMAAFGLGIATVLLGIAYAAQASFSRRRSAMLTAGKAGKQILGGMLLAVGLLIVTGADRMVEGVLLEVMPSSLVDLTVQF